MTRHLLLVLCLGVTLSHNSAAADLDLVQTIVAAPQAALAPLASPNPLEEIPCELVRTRFDIRDVWLGHFTGGRWLLDESGYRHMDWRDRTTCFVSKRVCENWLKFGRANFSQLEGWTTCLRLR